MTTPKQFATVAFALSDAMRILGRSSVAAVCGVSETMLYKGCNPNIPHGLSFLTYEHVRMLIALLRSKGQPEHFTAALDCEAGYLADDLAELRNEDISAMALRGGRDFGGVNDAILRAIHPDSDGGTRITAQEAIQIITNIDAMAASIADLRRRVVIEAGIHAGEKGVA